jgi:hypothetical protein
MTKKQIVAIMVQLQLAAKTEEELDLPRRPGGKSDLSMVS